MSGPTIDRLAALRASMARVAREKRQRETLPERLGRLAGHYRGQHGPVFLEWVEPECGYRLHVPQAGPWRWEDPSILSTAEVERRITSGRWTYQRGGLGLPGLRWNLPSAPSDTPVTKDRGSTAERSQKPRSEDMRNGCVSRENGGVISK